LIYTVCIFQGGLSIHSHTPPAPAQAKAKAVPHAIPRALHCTHCMVIPSQGAWLFLRPPGMSPAPARAQLYPPPSSPRPPPADRYAGLPAGRLVFVSWWRASVSRWHPCKGIYYALYCTIHYISLYWVHTPVRYAIVPLDAPYIYTGASRYTIAPPTPVRYAVCPWVATVTQG
jgi:hypothetical protein